MKIVLLVGVGVVADCLGVVEVHGTPCARRTQMDGQASRRERERGEREII